MVRNEEEHQVSKKVRPLESILRKKLTTCPSISRKTVFYVI